MRKWINVRHTDRKFTIRTYHRKSFKKITLRCDLYEMHHTHVRYCCRRSTTLLRKMREQIPWANWLKVENAGAYRMDKITKTVKWWTLKIYSEPASAIILISLNITAVPSTQASSCTCSSNDSNRPGMGGGPTYLNMLINVLKYVFYVDILL